MASLQLTASVTTPLLRIYPRKVRGTRVCAHRIVRSARKIVGNCPPCKIRLKNRCDRRSRWRLSLFFGRWPLYPVPRPGQWLLAWRARECLSLTRINCRFSNCYGGNDGCGCDRGRPCQTLPDRSSDDTLGAKIFKSTHRFFAHAEQSSDAWPFDGRATGRGFCIPCSAVGAVFFEPVDGGTAQRSTRLASRRCTADRLARQSDGQSGYPFRFGSLLY